MLPASELVGETADFGHFRNLGQVEIGPTVAQLLLRLHRLAEALRRALLRAAGLLALEAEPLTRLAARLLEHTHTLVYLLRRDAPL